MKKMLLPFMGILLFSANVFGQDTLKSTDYGTVAPVIGADSLMTTTSTSAYPANLVATANGTWDLTVATDTPIVFYAYRVNPDTAEAEFADSNYYTFASYFTYQGNVQTGVTASAWVNYGVDIPYSYDSLDKVVSYLSSSDNITITSQHAVYSSPETVLAFPATYNSTWTNTYFDDFAFTITADLFLIGGHDYANTPGKVRSHFTETDSVIGWGKMRVNDANGNPSGYMNVLQVSVWSTRQDSFFLYWSATDTIPASSVLDVFKVSEGQTSTTHTQYYYRVGEFTPLATISFDTSGKPTNATTEVSRLASPTAAVAMVNNENNVNIYPNPVATIRTVTLSVPSQDGNWTYDIINMTGQTVANDVLPLDKNQTSAQISLPASIKPGIYYIRLYNSGKQVSVKPLDIAQ